MSNIEVLEQVFLMHWNIIRKRKTFICTSFHAILTKATPFSSLMMITKIIHGSNANEHDLAQAQKGNNRSSPIMISSFSFSGFYQKRKYFYKVLKFYLRFSLKISEIPPYWTTALYISRYVWTKPQSFFFLALEIFSIYSILQNLPR